MSTSFNASISVSSAYCRLRIFLPPIVIPRSHSSSTFFNMYSEYMLYYNGDSMHPCLVPFLNAIEHVYPNVYSNKCALTLAEFYYTDENQVNQVDRHYHMSHYVAEGILLNRKPLYNPRNTEVLVCCVRSLFLLSVWCYLVVECYLAVHRLYLVGFCLHQE